MWALRPAFFSIPNIIFFINHSIIQSFLHFFFVLHFLHSCLIYSSYSYVPFFVSYHSVGLKPNPIPLVRAQAQDAANAWQLENISQGSGSIHNVSQNKGSDAPSHFCASSAEADSGPAAIQHPPSQPCSSSTRHGHLGPGRRLQVRAMRFETYVYIYACMCVCVLYTCVPVCFCVCCLRLCVCMVCLYVWLCVFMSEGGGRGRLHAIAGK